MEPNTFWDIERNVFHTRQKDNALDLRLVGPMRAERLIYDLVFATVFCRLHYFRVSSPIPKDLEGQAGYWKKYYNTPRGAGTTKEYVDNYRKYVK